LREPSSDTLFVANLPFATKDEELKDFFKEYNPTKAYVVVGRNGRSKGFGFVCFGDAAAQQAALKCDGALCQERPIAVRIALNPEPREKQEDEAAAAASPKEEEKKSD
jgi:RNA recognition motif-containing protein